MKKNKLYGYLSISICVLLLSAGVSAQDDRLHKIDSLRGVVSQTAGDDRLKAYMQLSSYYFPLVKDDGIMKEFLSLSAEIDAEAARQKRYDYQGILQVNILGVYANRGEYEDVIRLAPEYLDFLDKHEVWNYYYQVYQKLCRAYWRLGDVKNSLSEAQKMFEHAKSRQNNEGMGMALFAMADVYYTQYRFDRQIECLQQSILLLRSNHTFYHVVINEYTSICHSLLCLNRNEEAMHYADELEKLINEYEALAGTTVLNARWNLWSARILIYTATGRYDEAEALCQKLDSVNSEIANKTTVYRARARIFLSRKQYQKALELANRAMALYEEQVTFPGGYTAQNIRSIQIESLVKLERAEEAYALFKEDIAFRDSTRNTEMNARLDEIHTIYEVDKLEKEKEIISLEKQRNYNYFLFALGGCLLLSVTATIVILNRRKIVRKNRGLVQQIKEQDRLATELKDMTGRYNAAIANLQNKDTLNETDERKIFVSRLHEYLIVHRLYMNSNIERDNIVATLGTNKTYLFETIKAVTGKTLQEYINDMRLDEARRMLESSPKLTAEAIAKECGFSIRTFYRLFRERYQISPLEYRKILREERK